MARTWRALHLIGLLGLGLLGSVGCVTVQMGPGGEPVPTAMRPSPAEPAPAKTQQASYAAPAAGTPPAAVPPPAIPPTVGPPPVGPPPVLGPGLAAEPMIPLDAPPPTELDRRSLPPYRVAPPDILILDTGRLIPRGPYAVSPLDQLLIRVADTGANPPIDGVYTVSPEGIINLGYNYGAVRVGGLTLEDAEKEIRRLLGRTLEKPLLSVGLAQYRGVQQVRGTHLVRPDGTIHLGTYGCVYVAGLCLNEIKVAVERYLSQWIADPDVSVDVLGYNSKVIYVISDGAGYGQSVYRVPSTGNETVLDVIAQVQGLSQVASKKKIWVARPAPAHNSCLQVLPVDWRAITEGGATTTNYQLFPGDRVYIGPDPWILFDNRLAKIFAPIERIFGVTLLGSSAINNVRAIGTGNGTGTGTAFIAPIR